MGRCTWRAFRQELPVEASVGIVWLPRARQSGGILKKRLHDLAILGGTPEFRQALHVGGPNLGDPEKLLARFRKILDDRWFTNDGRCVQELEDRLANTDHQMQL